MLQMALAEMFRQRVVDENLSLGEMRKWGWSHPYEPPRLDAVRRILES